MYLRWPSAKMVSNASELLPEPETPVITTSESRGIKKGVVVNLERTIQSIEEAVSAAEKMAGAPIGPVTVGIAGDHIKSINSRGVIGVRNPDNEITAGDVERVIEAARAVALPGDREIIHVLPQEFTVDDQGGIHDPVGMTGVRVDPIDKREAFELTRSLLDLQSTMAR